MVRCIGCGRAFNLQPPFSITCACGGHVFHDKNDHLFLPASLAQYLASWHKSFKSEVEAPHLDYLVGTSSYSSELKAHFITFLQGVGCVWMKDCQQCRKDGTLQEEMEREAHLAVKEAERIMRGVT